MNQKRRLALKRAIDRRRREINAIQSCPDGYGNETGYIQGCRCSPCSDAGRQARAGRRRKPNVKVHNYSGYTNGCRCRSCKAARATWMKNRRAALAS
jgi:hypothetical protein